MAVSALELRPRGAIALLDAALRLCARNTGVWALTLPAGALVTAALLHLADSVARAQPLVLPSLWLTLAWLARGLGQGAACHYLQELLVGGGEPGMRASLKAALSRAPSLFIAVAFMAVLNGATLLLSMGLAFFFISAHVVGYAAVMQGRGSALGLYGTCARLLGPARGSATWVRMLLLVQGLVFLNLHIASGFLFFLGRKLVGIDLTYAERFASLDNPAWLLFLAALTFALFEPLKAATATLLLVDGRVRQEGLDLLAAVQQLPPRGAAKGASRGVAALVLLGALLAGAPEARAEQEGPASSGEVAERLAHLAEFCEGDTGQARDQARTVEALSPAEQLKFQRLLRRVESQVYGEEECGSTMQALERGVQLAGETLQAEQAGQDARAASARAQAILQRPEFAVAPPTPQGESAPKDTVPPDSNLWRRFIDWLGKLLEEWFKRRPPPEAAPRSPQVVSGASAANALAVALIGGVLVVLAVLLVRALAGQKKQEAAQLEVSTLQASALSSDPASALSRPPEGWAHAADELAGRGEYREAVRCLYLALLSRLHRDGAITYDVTLSNWDYLRHFKGQREWLPPFRELTYRFDFAWYGNVPVGAEGYQDFRALTSPLLSAPAIPEAARA